MGKGNRQLAMGNGQEENPLTPALSPAGGGEGGRAPSVIEAMTPPPSGTGEDLRNKNTGGTPVPPEEGTLEEGTLEEAAPGEPPADLLGMVELHRKSGAGGEDSVLASALESMMRCKRRGVPKAVLEPIAEVIAEYMCEKEARYASWIDAVLQTADGDGWAGISEKELRNEETREAVLWLLDNKLWEMDERGRVRAVKSEEEAGE